MKTVGYTGSARRAFRALPAAVQRRVSAKLAGYASTGIGDVRALSGRPGRRLRVGDYRVIFNETEETIEVLAVGHRKDVYD